MGAYRVIRITGWGDVVEDRWQVYLFIVARVGRSGVLLKDLEDALVAEFGLSLSMARYYVRRLKASGWVRYTRPYKDSKTIWVEPRRKLINYIMDLKEQYGI